MRQFDADYLSRVNEWVKELCKDIKRQNEAFADELSQIKIYLHTLLKNNDVDKELCNIFPIRSKEDLLRLEEQLNDYDEKKLQSVVKKIISRGGILKNLHNLLGGDIIKDFNYDCVQNKEALKSYFKVDNL